MEAEVELVWGYSKCCPYRQLFLNKEWHLVNAIVKGQKARYGDCVVDFCAVILLANDETFRDNWDLDNFIK